MRTRFTFSTLLCGFLFALRLALDLHERRPV